MINERIASRPWMRVVAALALGGCALAGSRAPLALPLSDAVGEQARRVAARGRGAEIVYLGELHDNPHHHARQVLVVEALLAQGARPALAFEMLHAEQQPAVDAALTSAAPAAELDRQLGWTERGWPDFAMYWPLLDLARRHRLRVIATDLEPGLARRIAREGLTVAPEPRRLVSLLSEDARREAAIARTIRTAHCGALPERQIPRLVESWHARNVTMAGRLAEAIGEHAPVVMIVGRGHLDPGGLPAQLEALRPATRQLVVDLVEAGGEGPGTLRGGRDDVVWLTPTLSRPDPCEAFRRRPRGGRAPGAPAGGFAYAACRIAGVEGTSFGMVCEPGRTTSS